MCYSGRCYFECYDGECSIINFDQVQDLTGEHACYIGRGEADSESQEQYALDEKAGNIDKWIGQIIDNNLTIRRRSSR